MHEAQRMVARFHRELGIPQPCACEPGIRRGALRATLLAEEANEAIDAIASGLLVPTIGELCDVLVVTYGAALEFGVDLEPHFAETMGANMAKAGGPVRDDGKVLKPEGWLPADHHGILMGRGGRYT